MTAPKRILVEKGIPIPDLVIARHLARGTTSGRKSRFPLEEMEVGDSFIVPPRVKKEAMRYYCSVKGGRLGYKFMVGLDDDQVLRVWRYR